MTTYTYDPFNRRTSKNSNGELTEFIWQGNKLVAQTRNHHRDWQTFIYELGTHRPLALIGGHKRDNPYKELPKVYWYQLDHLGTPQGLTDIQGQMVYTCEYDAYGKLRDECFLQNEDSGERLLKLRNPLRFQGQYEDEESGLFYNLNRYYDPSLGRYLSQDPVKLAGGLNQYIYVDGNSVGWVDPLGLKGIPTISTPNQNYRAIAAGVEDLSVPQAEILAQLPEFGSTVIVPKGQFGQNDLAALSAATGDEFAMFTVGGRRMIMCGDEFTIPIGETEAKALAAQGWRWSSHVHPDGALGPSEGDIHIIKFFTNKKSTISDPYGKRGMFDKNGVMISPEWKP
ncbi:RHS repeat domain-containing protein [Budvicia aquatica]|uniref:RHS repeat domain-containing protein n=1 Tax=Budvicia aquatica TaxID=82979 RepID=UPI00208847E0|nr:hypothetical protein SOASR029_06450 [Budvicia aquatica]